MTKKGQIEEIINYAKHFEGTNNYQITYRNLDRYIEIPLNDWLLLSEMDSIPNHRIYKIKKNDKLLFERPLR